MIRILLLVSILFCSTHVLFGQELDTALQANETLYPFDMRYIGSESNVDPNYHYMLVEIAEMLQKDSIIHLHIRGHVCCGPSYRLSKRRAKRTYNYLIALGAPREQMSWKGYSDTCPRRWPEKTNEDTAINRRVDFVIRTMK